MLFPKAAQSLADSRYYCKRKVVEFRLSCAQRNAFGAENKATLTKLLTYHVVSGRLMKNGDRNITVKDDLLDRSS